MKELGFLRFREHQLLAFLRWQPGAAFVCPPGGAVRGQLRRPQERGGTRSSSRRGERELFHVHGTVNSDSGAACASLPF